MRGSLLTVSLLSLLVGPARGQATHGAERPVEREIRSRDGKWYLVRYRPYRSAEDKIEGIVITFVEVTERRRMEEELRGSFTGIAKPLGQWYRKKKESSVRAARRPGCVFMVPGVRGSRRVA